MKIVADERVAALGETFGRHGAVLRLDGLEIEREHLKGADALLTRTVTRVDRHLLEGTPVRFVGTATIGSDHIDTAYLESQGIRWTAAPGCNADATAQYTLAMYLLACRRLGKAPRTQRFGIVGRGNVGGRLAELLGKLGVETIACDPPLEAQGVQDLYPIEEILGCDAVSLHVPLTGSGRWPTYRMFNTEMFEMLSTESLLINACRGDVVDGAALRHWQSQGGSAALDVWPGEPEIDADILDRSIVASPHIAGYSLDGKYRASAMVYGAFCETFGLEAFAAPNVQPAAPDMDVHQCDFESALLDACPVERDDAAMRGLLEIPAGQRAEAFHQIRSGYPLRRDLPL